MLFRFIVPLAAFLFLAHPALAGIELGLGDVKGTPEDQRATFAAALKAALADEIKAATASGQCEIKEAGATPTDRVSAEITPAEGGKIHYTIKATATSGQDTASTAGEANLEDAARSAAKAMIEALCKHGDTPGAGPQHLTLKYNDLVLDDKICDLTKPFAIKAKGKTKGLTLSFAPEKSTGGKWTVSGIAGGVPWSGGGEYEAAPATPAGTLVMRGKWSIKTPVGVYAFSDAMKGKLEPAPGPCTN